MAANRNVPYFAVMAAVMGQQPALVLLQMEGTAVFLIFTYGSNAVMVLSLSWRWPSSNPYVTRAIFGGEGFLRVKIETISIALPLSHTVDQW